MWSSLRFIILYMIWLKYFFHLLRCIDADACILMNLHNDIFTYQRCICIVMHGQDMHRWLLISIFFFINLFFFILWFLRPSIFFYDFCVFQFLYLYFIYCLLILECFCNFDSNLIFDVPFIVNLDLM